MGFSFNEAEKFNYFGNMPLFRVNDLEPLFPIALK
jgi:hypothetical protein